MSTLVTETSFKLIGQCRYTPIFEDNAIITWALAFVYHLWFKIYKTLNVAITLRSAQRWSPKTGSRLSMWLCRCCISSTPNTLWYLVGVLSTSLQPLSGLPLSHRRSASQASWCTSLTCSCPKFLIRSWISRINPDKNLWALVNSINRT